MTALCWLSRRIWRYAPPAVIALWWLYGWHVGVTALFVSYGIAWFALYEKQVASREHRIWVASLANVTDPRDPRERFRLDVARRAARAADAHEEVA